MTPLARKTPLEVNRNIFTKQLSVIPTDIIITQLDISHFKVLAKEQG